MTMHYSTDAIEQLEQGRQDVFKELRAVCIDLASKLEPTLTCERAREYISHGVCRRLTIMQQCIENVFALFPPEKRSLLAEDERINVEISLHAFLINTQGVPDSLAWAYVHERGIEINPIKVGLFQEDFQRLHLPPELVSYLDGSVSVWHKKYAKNYRDALAHRIPPYLPPAIQTDAHREELKNLETRQEQAIKDKNSELALELEDAKNAIGISCPFFYLDQSPYGQVLFHSQLIVDARTIMQIIDNIRPHLVRRVT